ncbi:hypothetical protein L209DRAFT_762438 [Thermothelomyces heterothallicus CBS 203.75]
MPDFAHVGQWQSPTPDRAPSLTHASFLSYDRHIRCGFRVSQRSDKVPIRLTASAVAWSGLNKMQWHCLMSPSNQVVHNLSYRRRGGMGNWCAFSQPQESKRMRPANGRDPEAERTIGRAIKGQDASVPSGQWSKRRGGRDGIRFVARRQTSLGRARGTAAAQLPDRMGLDDARHALLARNEHQIQSDPLGTRGMEHAAFLMCKVA